jgi:UDPglucose 6-dehydrogenase
MSRVAIVGAGYVGLVTGACLAELGHIVTVVDIDADRVEQISRGECPIHEPRLPELIRRHAGDRLRATTNLVEAVRAAEVTFIAVGTPSLDDGSIDLTAARASAAEIGAALRDNPTDHLVVIKSTVVPGTTERVLAPTVADAAGKSADDGVVVAVNPEFLTEGRAVQDFLEPDRIVVGVPDRASAERVFQLYEALPAGVPRLHTTRTTAEMTKYASNALLATAISFANEIADLCAALPDADIVDVMHGVHLSGYLSRLEDRNGAALAPLTSFLEAGCGFGGSCLPKDVSALIAHGRALGLSTPILSAVLDVNAGRAEELVSVVRESLGSLENASVTVLGLAFKPDTDDVRETPALPVIRGLIAAGARVTAHDPVVRALPGELEDVELVESLEAAVASADAVVIVTRWPQYEELPALLERIGRAPVIADGRRMLDKTVARYTGIGLGQQR